MNLREPRSERSQHPLPRVRGPFRRPSPNGGPLLRGRWRHNADDTDRTTASNDPNTDVTTGCADRLQGETIAVDIRWNGRLEVKGYPILILQIGTNERTARMDWVENRTNSAWVRFRYRVRRDDRDTDGVSIERDAIYLPDGSSILSALSGEPASIDLGASAINNDPAQKVHALENAVGHRLRIHNLWVLSSPSDYDTGYIAGDAIEIDIRWEGQIRVDGIPYMNLEIGEHIRPATMIHHSRTDIRFRYIVQRDDHDPDGISFAEDAIQLVNGSSIFSPATGQPVELSLVEWAAEHDDFHKVRPHDPFPTPRECSIERREARLYKGGPPPVLEWDGTPIRVDIVDNFPSFVTHDDLYELFGANR